MTGSGKTGLGIDLIEECAIDAVPVIAIDPKGDLGNLLLTFPKLAAEDFLPWVDADEARRAGQTVEAFAAAEAKRWSKGLADWGQDGKRIERLRDAAEFALYTPGSSSGRPLSIMKSFAAPDPEVVNDAELLQDRVSTAATSVLTLAGVDAEPIKSREHVLLATLFTDSWRAGRDLDLPALIAQIQSPPIARVGVLDLESFFPSKDRFALAMQLNQLLAAPGFRRLARRRGTRHRSPALRAERPSAGQRDFDRPSRRPGADVLRVAAAERDRRLDAQPARHLEPARARVLRRDLRLSAAGGEPAVETAAADAA